MEVAYEQATAQDHRQIVEALDAALATTLEQAANLGDASPEQGQLALDGLVVPAQTRSRPDSKAAKAKRPVKTDLGLRVYDPQPNARFGKCAGGSYEWVDDVNRAITFLNYWAEQRCWAGIDLETSCGWRNFIDNDGVKTKTHFDTKKNPEPISSDPFTSVIFLAQISVQPGYAYVFDMRPFMRDPRFMTAFRRFLVRCKLVAHDSLFEQSFFMVKFFMCEEALAEGYAPYTGGNMQYDTAITHRIITAGVIKSKENDYGSVHRKYTGITLDKAWQSRFLHVDPASPLPDDALVYAAGDVTQMLYIAGRIHQELQAYGVEIWEQLERPLMYWVARARVRGVKRDEATLLKFREKMHEQLVQATADCARLLRMKVKKRVPIGAKVTAEELASLNEQVLQIVKRHGGSEDLAERLGRVLGAAAISRAVKNCQWIEYEVEEPVNVGSPKQLLEWFKARGCSWLQTSTDEKALESIIGRTKKEGVRQAAQAVLRYRNASKSEATYIIPFLVTHCNPFTGKIHSYWKQCPTETGRMSSADPNMQNIPSRDEELSKIRNAFIADEGHVLITCDYSQFEVRSLAEQAGERAMLEIFIQRAEVNRQLRAYCNEADLEFFEMEGLHERAMDDKANDQAAQLRWAQIAERHPEVERLVKKLVDLDFHRRTAANLFYNGDTAKVTKADRKKSKAVTFAVPYGSGAPGISSGVGISLEDAQKLLDTYMGRHRMVEMFLRRQKGYVQSRGYTETLGGRRRFYRIESIPQKIEKHRPIRDAAMAERNAAREEWLRQSAQAKINRQEPPPQPAPGPKQTAWEGLLKKWRSGGLEDLARRMWKADIGSAERQAVNAPIQGNNADATKLATLLMAPRLAALHPECMVVMWVHDEIVVTAPREVAKEAALIVEWAMIEGARRYLKRVPIEVSCAIDTCWTK